MKKSVTFVLSIGLLCGDGRRAAGAPEPSGNGRSPDTVLGCHFAGLESVLADTNCAKLKQIWSLPATAALKSQFLDQLARVPFLAASNQLPKGADSQAALFRPLLDDLLPGESFFEWRGPAGRPTECMLAVQVTDARAQAWSTNLWKALDTWKLGRITSVPVAGGQGWVFRPAAAGNAVGFARAGQWVVVGLGPEPLALHAQALQHIKAEGRPGPKPDGRWLTATANLERLKPWLPPLAPYAHPPIAHLSLSNHADNVRTVVRMGFPGGHGWKGEPWLLPKAVIRDPLISFTAVQGIAPLLKPWKAFQKLAFAPPPNQLMVWAQSTMPFLTHWAIPLKEAGPQLSRVTPILHDLVLSNDLVKVASRVYWDTNIQGVVWQGMPMAEPHLMAMKEGNQEYLLGGLFRSFGGTNPPPAELFRQLEDRNNLVYYDWEITQARLRQWRPLYQLLDIADKCAFAPTNAPTQRFLFAVEPMLGNTATEITATSPTELTLVRKSHLGLTGFELFTLTRWVDSPGFPRFNVEGKPKVVRPTPTGRPKPK